MLLSLIGLALAELPPDPVYWNGSMQGERSLEELAARGEVSMAREWLLSCAGSREIRVRALGHALILAYHARLGFPAEPAMQALLRMARSEDAPGYARDRACQGLMNLDWPGRSALYRELLHDASLLSIRDGRGEFHPLQWGVKTQSVALRQALLMPGALRNSAVAVLLEASIEEPALLPWVTEPDWANGPRLAYIDSLAGSSMPDVIPALMKCAENDSGAAGYRAAVALGKHRDARALPALRAALARANESERPSEDLLKALFACGGQPSRSEVVAAVLAYARGERNDLGKFVVDRLDSAMFEQLRKSGVETQILKRILFAGDAGYRQEHMLDEPLTPSVLRTLMAQRSKLETAPLVEALDAGGTRSGRAAALLERPISDLTGVDSLNEYLDCSRATFDPGLVDSLDKRLSERPKALRIPVETVRRLAGSPQTAAAANAWLAASEEGDLRALEAADEVLLLTLNPTFCSGSEPGRLTFHSYPILDHALVRGDQKSRLARAVCADLRTVANGLRPMCFEPRHALHFVQDGHEVDILLCYECGRYAVFRDGVGHMNLLDGSSYHRMMATVKAHAMTWDRSR